MLENKAFDFFPYPWVGEWLADEELLHSEIPQKEEFLASHAQSQRK